MAPEWDYVTRYRMFAIFRYVELVRLQPLRSSKHNGHVRETLCHGGFDTGNLPGHTWVIPKSLTQKGVDGFIRGQMDLLLPRCRRMGRSGLHRHSNRPLLRRGSGDHPEEDEPTNERAMHVFLSYFLAR